MSETYKAYRNAKGRLYRQRLMPAGFVQGVELFVRHQKGQLHAIQFQASRYGKSYFVNVAFHYDFIPPLLAADGQTRSYDIEAFGLMDFMFRARLEKLSLSARTANGEWRYDRDIGTVERELNRNADDAIVALGAVAEKWRDPKRFLEALSPKLLEKDAQRGRGGVPPVPRLNALAAAWSLPDYFTLGYALAIIALKNDRLHQAREYLKIAELDAMGRRVKTVKEVQRDLENTIGRAPKRSKNKTV